jgi:hypothetical protein
MPSPIDYSAFSIDQLLHALAQAGDRAPQEMFEACVARGGDMLEPLRAAIDGDSRWDDGSPEAWWLFLHAAFILGRIPGVEAGATLIHLMRRLDAIDEPNQQDWLAGYWPALFANKPPETADAARALAEDDSIATYMRAQALGIVIDAGRRAGHDALEASLDWLAAWITNTDADWDFRLLAACDLLDFPRERHRALLEAIVAEQAQREVFARMFVQSDIEHAYALDHDEPRWLRFANPWAFYDPLAIERRQQLGFEEITSVVRTKPVWESLQPYVRAHPKIGRNEPCPCGSGKKFKRCCLPNTMV